MGAIRNKMILTEETQDEGLFAVGVSYGDLPSRIR
jgi:hypothetical protein